MEDAESIADCQQSLRVRPQWYPGSSLNPFSIYKKQGSLNPKTLFEIEWDEEPLNLNPLLNPGGSTALL